MHFEQMRLYFYLHQAVSLSIQLVGVMTSGLGLLTTLERILLLASFLVSLTTNIQKHFKPLKIYETSLKKIKYPYKNNYSWSSFNFFSC